MAEQERDDKGRFAASGESAKADQLTEKAADDSYKLMEHEKGGKIAPGKDLDRAHATVAVAWRQAAFSHKRAEEMHRKEGNERKAREHADGALNAEKRANYYHEKHAPSEPKGLGAWVKKG